MTLGIGPLAGIRVVEFAGLGPAPFCGMLLSDLGADVIRIDRQGGRYNKWDVITRGRRSVALDLKQPESVELALRLIDRADMLIEGFRPGVMERLGLGPEVALERRPALVYGRMTGWGQTGSKAREPGHDINYIAAAGVLHAIGTKEQPAIPINLVGDFGGGALYLAFGMLAALTQSRASGRGQVVDCAMLDGATSLMTMIYGRLGEGIWKDERQMNSIDGGAHYYSTYECADGRFIALGAFEPKFYANLLAALDLPDADDFRPQYDRERWPEWRARFAAHIAKKTRDEWMEALGKSETCATPVLSMHEAAADPGNAERGLFSTIDGVLHVNPAPRFSASPDIAPGPITMVGDGQEETLADWGLDTGEIAELQAKSIVSPA